MNAFSDHAREFANQFQTSIRDNGDVFVTIKHDGPDRDTLVSMAFAANQAGISDDYAYSMVRDVLDLIADEECDNLDEARDLSTDNLIDFHDNDLIRFIADGLNRQFAQDVMDNMGPGAFGSFTSILSYAQDEAYRAALNAVVDNWPEEEDEEEEEETDISEQIAPVDNGLLD